MKNDGASDRDEECANVIAWLRHYQHANTEARAHSREPAHDIDLRARANNCQMHAIWHSMGKQRESARDGVNLDEMLRIRAAVRDLTNATIDSQCHPLPDNASVEVYVSDLRILLGLRDNDGAA